MRLGRGARRIAVATTGLVVAATVPLATTTAVAGPTATTSLTIESEQGDSLTLTSDDATFEVGGDATAIDVAATSAAGEVVVEIDAPTGSSLAAGQTVPLAAAPATDEASVTVTRDGQSCASASGDVTVSELAFDDAGNVSSLDAEFSLTCEADGSALRGTLHHEAITETPPTTVPPTRVPPTTVSPTTVPDVGVTQGDVGVAETSKWINSLFGGYRHSGDTRFYRYSPSCRNGSNIATCPIFFTTLTPSHPFADMAFTVQLKIKKGWQRIAFIPWNLDENSQTGLIFDYPNRRSVERKTFRIRAEWTGDGDTDGSKGKYRYLKIMP